LTHFLAPAERKALRTSTKPDPQACLRLVVQPNISCSAVSQLLVDLTRLGITDELLANQSVTFRLCSLAITLLLCYRKLVQCTSSQDMHWRGCELHWKHWLKRHASLQAKVLPLKPAAFTCRLQSGMSCNHLQNCMATAATLPQLRCTGQGLDMSQTLSWAFGCMSLTLSPPSDPSQPSHLTQPDLRGLSI